MRKIWMVAVPALAIGTALLATGGSMPDPAREYHQQVDCHNAYDRLIYDGESGEVLTVEDIAWGKQYEANANAGTPCPAPLPSMVARGGNWMLRTENGLKGAAIYSTKLNDPVAMTEVGLAWVNQTVPGGTVEEGLFLVKKAAGLGDPVALFQVGSLYSSGGMTGTPDHKTGYTMMDQAAKAGHIDAIYRTGLYLMNGIGTKKDSKKAFAAFKTAAERGHLYSTIMAIDMINEGNGTKKDFALAYRLARIIADQGEMYGALQAASSLLQGKDPLKHEDEILYWLDEGIAKGDDTIRGQLIPLKQQVIGAFTKAKAPPQYTPRQWKACPMKTVCTVNHFSGLQSCTTNKDYWNDCDG